MGWRFHHRQAPLGTFVTVPVILRLAPSEFVRLPAIGAHLVSQILRVHPGAPLLEFDYGQRIDARLDSLKHLFNIAITGGAICRQ